MYHIKEDHRNQVSCDLIFQALAKLIDQVGLENINIKVLVETAGVGRATFYRSFDTLDDVLQYQSDQAIQELTSSVYSKLKDHATISEHDIFVSFFRFWSTRTELLRTLIHAKRFWMLEKSLDEVFQKRLSFIQELLNMPFATWKYFIKMRTAMLTSILEEWVESGEKENADELADILLRSFHHVEIQPNQFSIE